MMFDVDVIDDDDNFWQDCLQQGSEKYENRINIHQHNIDNNIDQINSACVQKKQAGAATPKTNSKQNRFTTKVKNIEMISTRTLGEILNLPPLNVFLYIMTQKEPNFFVDQLKQSDNMERVILYIRIFVTVCELELPGFQKDLLREVALNKQLLWHFENIGTKLFSKRFKTMWADLDRADLMIYYMQSLLIQAQKSGVMTDEGRQVLFNVWMLLKKNETPYIGERAVCVQFAQQLNKIFSVEDEFLAEPIPADNLYPTHNEVLNWCSSSSKNNNNAGDLTSPNFYLKYDSVDQYINNQRHVLRQNFLQPLREIIQKLNKSRNLKNITEHQIAFENVEIKLNKNFADASRHKLIFVDVLAGQRENNNNSSHQNREGRGNRNGMQHCSLLEKIKWGSLICLTSNYDFQNLVFASVLMTDTKLLRKGYIGVVIIRQYNIGNVYNKRFIMFEAPSFFEPYDKAYRYLNNCNVLNFPMAKYICLGQINGEPPAYLSKSQPALTYQDQKFLNKLKNLPLNQSQREAFHNSLKSNFNLIQGPPGTGKTHLMLHLLKALIDNAKSSLPIVLLTYTNESLDKFLLKLSTMLKSNVSIVRFGCQTRLPEITKYNARADMANKMINPRLKILYWIVNTNFKEKFQKLQNIYRSFDGSDEAYKEILATQLQVWNEQQKLNSIRTIFQHYLVQKKQVIAMTTTCASRMNFIFRFLNSKIVIFEEAAEILEAHILPCLTPYTEHIIMIGDHQQLKPFTTKMYFPQNSDDTNISLFERLLRGQFKTYVLNTQYRMRKSIVELLEPIYNDLQSHEIVDTFPAVRNVTKNVYFLMHNELEVNHFGLLHNDWEISKIIDIARYLLEVSLYSTKDIVVLSPYSKQVERIKIIFTNIPNMTNIIVSTVDSFQGMEANIVLLSLVRSNRSGNIGFLKEKTRICVALSRARYGLFIIGNMGILAANSPTWNDVQQKLLKHDAIGSEFPFEKKLT